MQKYLWMKLYDICDLLQNNIDGSVNGAKLAMEDSKKKIFIIKIFRKRISF